MEFINFPEANFTFLGGGIQDEDGRDVGDLKVFKDEHKIISKWRPTWRERLSILFFGNVWLFILGQGMPPVTLSGEKTVFTVPVVTPEEVEVEA